MRFVLVLALFAVFIANRVFGDEPDPRVAEALERTTKAATHYDFRLSNDSTDGLVFYPKSLLRWSNPVIGVIYGNVFVWTKNGRPEVIGSILQWYEPHKHATHEFHSLSPRSVEGSHDGKLVWTTKTPGLQYIPVPNRPVVDESPLVRLRQMRLIARQLKVTSTNKKGTPYNLRALSQPLFCYGDDKSNVVDGALFAFVQGTDPEVIVVIEARKDDAGVRQWQFAMARMAALKFVAEFQDNEVWRVEAMPYRTAMSGKQPYSLFRFSGNDMKTK